MTIFPTKIVPVVIGIIREDGKFLVAKRPPQVVMPDYWEFPGGKIEPNESEWEALCREMREELNIMVIEGSQLTYMEHVLEDRHIHMHVWQIQKYEGELCGYEGQEVRWITSEVFSDYTFLPSNGSLLKLLTELS